MHHILLQSSTQQPRSSLSWAGLTFLPRMGCASSNIKDEPAIGASSQHYHTGRSQFTGNGYSQPTAENTQAAASKYAYENTMSNSSGVRFFMLALLLYRMIRMLTLTVSLCSLLLHLPHRQPRDIHSCQVSSMATARNTRLPPYMHKCHSHQQLHQTSRRIQHIPPTQPSALRTPRHSKPRPLVPSHIDLVLHGAIV